MNKALSMIGLAHRAGKIRSGGTLGEKAVKQGEAYLLIIAEDSSENTKDKFISMAKYYETEYALFSTRELLGKFSGGGEKSVLCVCDLGFSEAIKKLL